MKTIVTILVGFVHDFASGCWLATVLAVYWIDKQTVSHELLSALFGLKKQFFYFGVLFTLTVFATGIGRTLTYVSNVYGEDSEKIRRKTLIVKHIILLIVYGLGTYWQYIMVFE
jgi:hypothetical protein